MRKDAISRLFQGRKRRRCASEERRRLALESLEGRRLLAVTGDAPAITGTVFVDRDGSGDISGGEGLENAQVELYLDDGDGISNGGDTLVGTDSTDANGLYCFDNLDGNATYFVVQPAQTVDGIPLLPMTSGPIMPGEPNLIIDAFETNQSVVAMSPAPSSDGSTLTFDDETEVIGAERDMFVSMTSGVGEVELIVNPFNLLPVLQFSSTSGVEGGSILTWDGIDNDPNPIPSLGLNGRDLTQLGANTGFTMRLGIDPSGAGDTVTIIMYQGDVSNMSSATVPIPVTDGTATDYLFMPFNTFSGSVSPDDVDAIQMRLGEGIPSADAQIAFLGVTGPQTQDFANDLPPTDLAITKSDGALTAVPGEDIRYTITVENLGPSDVIGAVIDDVFPPELSNVSYSSVATGSASGNTDGVGDITDLVNLPVDSTIVYTVDATIASGATGTLSNTATVTPPSTVTDTNLANNTSTDDNTLNRGVDLVITKTDNRDTISPGDQTTYIITVTNAGPSDVSLARVTDFFPAELNNVSYTSSAINGTVTGNTSSGNGDINDAVNMTAGSSLIYTVMATLDNSATQPLSNTATVDAPPNTTETDPSNNSATDTNVLVLTADLAITKDDGSTTVEPGQTLDYTIVVTNNGPNNVVGASVTDTFPNELTGVSYTSSATGGASGNTNGQGEIDDDVNLPVGSTITYNATGTVSTLATSDIVNMATVTEPVGVVDPTPSNNTDTDLTVLIPGVDLQISKTNNQISVLPGEQITYDIVVTNNGPNPVAGAAVQDSFPPELDNVAYTSEASGDASGNTNGVGDINDLLNLGVDGSVIYTVQASVADDAFGTLSNTATVSEPDDVVELDPSNNSSTDTDPIQQRLSSVSGSVYLDLDFDGLSGVGEPGIEGVEVVLEDADRNEIERTTTDEAGLYEFDPLAAGPYFLREVQPNDYRDGFESVTGDIGVVVASDLFFVNLADNDDATGLNFGDFPLQPSKRELLASRFRDFDLTGDVL